MKRRIKLLTALTVVIGLVAGVSVFSGCGAEEPTVIAKPSTSASPSPDQPGKTPGPANVVASGFGTFKGVIKYDGTVPSRPPLFKMGATGVKDPAVCAKTANIPDQSLIVNESNKGIENVFVYLQKVPKGAKVAQPPSEPAVFDQKNCTFLPHAMVVRTHRTINVISNDAVLHNTHSYPINAATEAFNKAVQPSDPKGIPLKYKGPEKLPVRIKCDIHPWMSAWHLPLDHDFAAVTDENGAFEIKNLPVGVEMEFRIWQEEAGFLERKYKVKLTKDGEVFEFDKAGYGPDQFK